MQTLDKQKDFFSSFPITTWLPNETLFSLCSRYHKLSGHYLPSTTCKMLFGHSYLGSQHDFPSRINTLEKVVHGTLGNSEQMILDHTILPYYLPFQKAAIASKALSSLSTGKLGSLKYQLGILTSRFRANHPLKACKKCIEENTLQVLTPYWHLDHQFPGSWLCLKHQSLLSICELKANGVKRFHWLLPDTNELFSPLISPNEQPSPELTKTLGALSHAAIELSKLRNFHFNSDQLQELVENRLYELGLSSSSGRLKHKEITDAYLNTVAPLRIIRELSSLPKNLQQAESQLFPVINFRRNSTHPIRILTLLIWLFNDWENFIQNYKLPTKRQTSASVPQSDTDSKREIMKSQVLKPVLEGRLSLTAAARRFEVDLTTAVIWATQEGIQVAKRPKKLTKDALLAICDDLRAGCDKGLITDRHDISRTTINRILRSDPQLNEVFKAAQACIKKEKYRQDWLDAIKIHGQSGIKATRMAANSIYSWLYRNDRTWLQSSYSQIKEIHQGNNSSVDWIERDNILAKHIQAVCEELKLSHPNKCLSNSDILKALPDIKPKLSALKKLPLTQQALKACTGNHSDLTNPNHSLFD